MLTVAFWGKTGVISATPNETNSFFSDHKKYFRMLMKQKNEKRILQKMHVCTIFFFSSDNLLQKKESFGRLDTLFVLHTV